MVHERLRYKFGMPLVGGEAVVRDELREEHNQENAIKKRVLNRILRMNKKYQLEEKFGIWKSKTKFVAKEGRDLLIKGSTEELEATK